MYTDDDMYTRQVEFLTNFAKDLGLTSSVDAEGALTLKSEGLVWAYYTKLQLTETNIRKA
jgi:hypothetical protein